MRLIFKQAFEFNGGSKAVVLVIALLLMSCSSHIPPDISEPPLNELKLEQVQTNIQSYLSQKVRWGGVILETENREAATWLTIMAQPLGSKGRPDATDYSHGRFIALVPHFLEPKLYARDREMTFTGRVKTSETRRVGEFDYNYPVIEVENYYLWPERLPDYRMDPYWYYDPWYYPYYPAYPYYPPRHIR